MTIVANEHGAVRWSDPSTSYAAARKVNATRLEWFVYDHLVEVYPRAFTAVEIARALHKSIRSISPRLKPLERKGMAVRVGKRSCLNDMGRPHPMITWAAVFIV